MPRSTYRSGYVVALFCDHPSYNFDGPPEVRRRLRRIRDENLIGKIQYVSFKPSEGGIECDGVNITSKRKDVPPGYANKRAWHMTSADIFKIARQLPFRCPRCWSSKHPETLFCEGPRSLRETLEASSPVLCDECTKMNFIRASNERSALADLTRDFIKRNAHHG